MQQVVHNGRVDQNKQEHDDGEGRVPVVEAGGSVAERDELQDTRPDNGEVGESDHLIDEDHPLVVVLFVEEDEEVFVLDLLVRVLRFVDQQTDVHDQPEAQDQSEVDDGVVDGAGEDRVLEELLEHQGSRLVEVVRDDAILDALSGLLRQPLHELHDV